MISRVADSCFWMHRYVERAENTARLLRVSRSFLLDVPIREADTWRSVVIVAGEQERFEARFGEEGYADAERVEQYLVWDDKSPVSISSSLRWARENARTTREVISAEMWAALNDLYNHLVRGPGRRQFGRDRDAFYVRVKAGADLFLGLSESTLLDDAPLDFMRLGQWLERAGQTARMLDVKHHVLGPGADSPVAIAQWTSLLHSCHASEAYWKKNPDSPGGAAIAAFLLLEPNFPRSVLGSLVRAQSVLAQVRARGAHGGAIGEDVSEQLDAIVAQLRAQTAEGLVGKLHEALTGVIDGCAKVGAALDAAYFHPGDQSVWLSTEPGAHP